MICGSKASKSQEETKSQEGVKEAFESVLLEAAARTVTMKAIIYNEQMLEVSGSLLQGQGPACHPAFGKEISKSESEWPRRLETVDAKYERDHET